MGTFLLIGGTGKVGARLGRLLTAAGHTARIASRSGGDVHFDWHDGSTYRSALTGADGAFIVGPGSASDWSPLLEEFLRVAVSCGVRRAVLLSARGVEFLQDGAVARAEKALRSGGVTWTILRPSHFAQNFTEAMFVPEAGRVLAPVGCGAEPFVDVQDLAEVAASVLTSDQWANEVVEISGPVALTFDEAVGSLGEAAGQPFTYVEEPAEQYRARLRSTGVPEGYITWRMAMLGGIRRGEDAYISDGIPRVLGRPATSFQTWLQRERLAVRAL
jgi:uncharacterized protein YbjT (DUF2867 family)